MLKARFGTLVVGLKIHRDGLHRAPSSTKSTNMGSTWRDLAQPRLNIGSGEAQLGAKMGQHAPKMAPLGRRWSPRGSQLRSTWPKMEPQRAQHARNRGAKL